MARWWRRNDALVCRDAVALIADYLEGRLAMDERRRLEDHLVSCPNCAEYLAQMRATIQALGQVTPDALSDNALTELVGLYRRWTSDEDNAPS